MTGARVRYAHSLEFYEGIEADGCLSLSLSLSHHLMSILTLSPAVPLKQCLLVYIAYTVLSPLGKKRQLTEEESTLGKAGERARPETLNKL